MRQNISAPAISRIISGTSVRKAPTGNTWGKGFTVTGYGPEVHVHYQDTDTSVVDRNLDYIVETINDRQDRKYFARKTQNEYGSSLVIVEARREDHGTEEAKEQQAAESPHAVTVAEVREVIQKGRYAYDAMGAGYVVERAEGFSDRLVRVSYKDHPHTGYALVVGGREGYKQSAVDGYAKDLVSAGYAAWVEYEENDGWSVLVGPADAFVDQDRPEDIKEALTDLREAVEASDLSYMTRKAGDHSLFVYYLVPFKDKLRRVEVFWVGGVYKLAPRFGGPAREFYNIPFLVEEIGREVKS